MFKFWKSFMILVIVVLMIANLVASFLMPVRRDIVRKETRMGDSFWIVTYQEKNIWGMKIGEEFRLMELKPYWNE